VWYPTIAKAGIRKRVMYQARHTFASLMLSYGEDRSGWHACWATPQRRCCTATTAVHPQRMRRDGLRFTQGLKEAGMLPEAANDTVETKKPAGPLGSGLAGYLTAGKGKIRVSLSALNTGIHLLPR